MKIGTRLMLKIYSVCRLIQSLKMGILFVVFDGEKRKLKNKQIDLKIK